MQKILLGALCCLALSLSGYAQNLAINADGSLPNPNAILDVKSGNKGVLIPRMGSAARKLIPPTQGLLVFDTTSHSFWYHTGTQWQSIATSSSALSAPGDPWLLNGNSGTDSTNFLGTIDDAHLHIRVNNKPSGLLDQHNNNATWGYNTGKFITTGYSNTALGNLSLYNLTTGFANTATGFRALFSNKEGISNTATGELSLYNNLTGYANAAMGSGSLYDNTGGYNNTAMGHISLYKNTDGNRNTALGAAALYQNTTGNRNTAGGYQALYENNTGSENVATGYQALYSNTTGNGSTATGYQALHFNTTGIGNTATGFQSLYANTIGSYNTADGYNALGAASGFANTAIGYESLYMNSGNTNTAVGAHTLKNNKGENNTAVGFTALIENTDGTNNTALGGDVLRSNTNGSYNTALGWHTMPANTTGSFNTAVGMISLRNNTTGVENTAVGFHASGLNSTGHHNTSVGFEALVANGSGIDNTSIGYRALFQSMGDYNTAVGMHALYQNTTGTLNTAIGYMADVLTTSNTATSNATAIGSGAVADASNKVRIGNAAVTVIEGQVPFTTPSDGRYKFKVQDDVKGLDFILQLRPVTYQFDVKRFDAQYTREGGELTPASNIIQASYDEATLMRRSGFIAQEVEKAANTSGYNFSGIIKPRTEKDHYSLSYDAFVVPLVKAVQEQQKIIEKLHQKNNDEQTRISRLEKQVEELLQLLKASK